MGVADVSNTTKHYGHPYIFLFLGGFLLASGMEKWSLHKRIALSIIRAIGTRPDRIILGFMLATAFISMWISNTATAVMMMPVATSLLQHRKDASASSSSPLSDFQWGEERLAKALMLGVAYAASIGGMSTLIGTPPNLVLAGVIKEHTGSEIGFIQWMLFAFPLCLVLLLGTWWYLTRRAFHIPLVNAMQSEKNSTLIEASGPMLPNEKRVLLVFGGMVFAWVFRSLLFEPWIPAFDDTLIALSGGLLLFLIPSSTGQGALLDWSDTHKLPWGILLLFGGGMALAHGFEQSGLASTIGSNLISLRHFHPLVFVFLVVVGVSIITEFTSNLAATTMILPVLLPVANGLNLSPLYLLTGATLAASCAFMMPVSTPPNAVVFATGHLKVRDMTRAGIFVNFLSALLIGLGVYYYMPLIFG
jgi:sodium-dependent dicarboxylate transporter 2/3/5